MDLGAITGFTLRTVKSAGRGGVMRTIAPYARLWFGHRSRVGALGSSMTHRRENDATRNSGMCPTKKKKQKEKEIAMRRGMFSPEAAGWLPRNSWKPLRDILSAGMVPQKLPEASARHFKRWNGSPEAPGSLCETV